MNPAMNITTPENSTPLLTRFFEERPGLTYGLLTLLTLFGGALRFYKLGAWSFWIDEIFTLQSTPYLESWPLTTLPLYLVAIRAAELLFGTTEWSARLAPAIVGTITLPLLYIPIRKLFGIGVALIAVLIIAVAPWHLYWSQNARFYVFMLLFYNLGMLLFLLGLSQGRKWVMGMGLVFLLLAVREKATALLFVPVIFSYFAVHLLLHRHGALKFPIRSLGMLAAIPLLVYIAYDIFTYVTGQESSILLFLSLFAGQANHAPLRLALAIIYRLGIPLVCLGAVGGLNVFWSKNPQEWFVTLGAVVPILAIVAISPFFFTVDRYVFVTLPFWAILAGVALERLPAIVSTRTALPTVALLSILVLSAMSENMLYFQYQNGNRPDWRTAFAIVAQAKQADDQILSTRPEMGEYYLKEKVDDVNTFTTTDIERGQQSFWFVIDETTGYVDPELHAWIKQHSTLVEVLDIHLPAKSISIRIYRYGPGWKVVQLQPLVLPALADIREG